MNNDFTIANSRTATKNVEVAVNYNDAVVTRAARAMAIGLMSMNDTVKTVLSMDQLIECFVYALKVMLFACSRTSDSGKKVNDLIPMFMCDLIKSLQMVERSMRVTTATLSLPERPDSYDDFISVCMSTGLPVGKALYPKAMDTSEILTYDVRKMDDVPSLFGTQTGPDLDQMIVRYMLDVADEERDKLLRILGNSDLYYCAGDELITYWANSSVAKVK